MGKYIKKAKQKKTDPKQALKLEAAKELGLLDKAKQSGWDMLTSQETGKIGAIVKKKLKSCKINLS
ncbi:MAG: Small, acid-soluble spore protein alpha/beta type [Tepidanaerobacteraceae bacterium]|nr:Small, acid-soluble spore protein alpha/beta type [Tepidanaerobacteraceae bacterium]